MQRIYQEYIDGTGFQAIAKNLNRDAVVSPGRWGALRSGNPSRIARTATIAWTAGSVIDIADAGFAAGLLTHNGQWHPGAHEPLIGQEQWQAYQRRREAQRMVPMYCTSSQRDEQYALYCGTQRTSGNCAGTYRTRKPIEDAVLL